MANPKLTNMALRIPLSCASATRINDSMVRVGLNYHFGSSVVAKYGIRATTR
jgi:hypothetical protein